MKIAVNEIKSISIKSRSALVVQISYKKGGSDTYNMRQLDNELTYSAYQKVMDAVREHDVRTGA